MHKNIKLFFLILSWVGWTSEKMVFSLKKFPPTNEKISIKLLMYFLFTSLLQLIYFRRGYFIQSHGSLCLKAAGNMKRGIFEDALVLVFLGSQKYIFIICNSLMTL